MHLSVACDMIALAMNPIGIIADRRIDRMLDEHHSSGLPAELIVQGKEGIQMGLMGGQFMTTSLVAENRTRTTSASIQSIPSTAAFQDVVSFGLISARNSRDIVANTQRIIAFEAICAAQAIDLRGGRDLLSKGGQAVYDLVRQVVPFFDDNKVYMNHMEQVAALVKDGSMLNAIENTCGPMQVTARAMKRYQSPFKYVSENEMIYEVDENEPFKFSNSSSSLKEFEKRQAKVFIEIYSGSAQAHKEMCQVMPGGNTKQLSFVEPFPLSIKSGDGPFMYTIENRELLDFNCGYGTVLLGHCNEEVEKAALKSVKKGTLFSMPTPAQHEFASHLIERIPCYEQVRFTNSGTEATLFALRLAKVHTKKNKLIMFRGGYHGTLDVTSQGGSAGATGAMNGITKDHHVIMADYNDVEGTRNLIREHGADLSTVLLEPFLGAGGIVPASSEFLTMLKEETVSTKSVLIYDEILSFPIHYHGMSTMLGRELEPDLLLLGKSISGGYPIGVFGGKLEIMKHCDPREVSTGTDSFLRHSGSFNGHDLSMNTGLATLKTVYNEKAVNELNAKGTKLAQALRDEVVKHGLNIQVQHMGRNINVHFTDETITSHHQVAKANKELSQALYMHMLIKGISMTPRGLILVSTAHEEEHLNKFVTNFGEGLQKLKPVIEVEFPHLLAKFSK